MNKFAMFMALALPVALVSCSDEEAALSLDQSSVTLDYGTKATLKASEKNGTWVSDNEFVATVDQNGEVTAKHIGKATISVTKDGEIAECVVTVNATNNNFTLPILNWGATVSSVKSSVGSSLDLLLDKENQLMYTQKDNAYPWYAYIFTENSLAGSMLVVDEDMDEDEDLQGFIEQRYAEVGETDNGLIYADAYTLTDADVAVTYEYDAELSAVTATWQPVSHTKSVVYDPDIVKQLKEIVKSAK